MRLTTPLLRLLSPPPPWPMAALLCGADLPRATLLCIAIEGTISCRRNCRTLLPLRRRTKKREHAVGRVAGHSALMKRWDPHKEAKNRGRGNSPADESLML